MKIKADAPDEIAVTCPCCGPGHGRHIALTQLAEGQRSCSHIHSQRDYSTCQKTLPAFYLEQSML